MALAEIVGLFEALQLNGSYRGIGFAFATGNDDPGRRILGFLYPGRDVRAFQDLGQDDGEIVFSGIMVGDDYVHQAARMKAAFQTPGPATLVSPWWGTIQVVQAPGKKPKFDYTHEKLRVVTFTATVVRYYPTPPLSVGTLQGLLDAIADLRTAALALLVAVLAPVALTLSTIAAVEALAGEAAGILGSLLLSVSNPLVGIAGGLPIGLLSGIGGIAPDARYGTTVGTLLTAPSAAIAGTTTPEIAAAVAPGGDTATPVPVDGRITAGLLLTAVPALAPKPSALAPVPALRVVVQAILLADAMQAASDIVFASQQEAMAWRDRMAAALDTAATAAAVQVPNNAIAATPLWRALTAARTAWLADMSATIGRLPRVVSLMPPAAVPVWLLAYYLYGSETRRMTAGYLDILARNDIRHPGEPPVGSLEVLV
jgi:prophage DNA circulation protein